MVKQLSLKNILEVIGKTVKEKIKERNSTAQNGDCLIKNHFMNTISFSKGELKICHKNNCVNVKGEIAKAITFGVAAIVIISGIASLLEPSK